MAKTTMTRSRTQLSTVYAPQSFFTFEGGTGACTIIPVGCARSDADTGIRAQIFDQIYHNVKSWNERCERQMRLTARSYPTQAYVDHRVLNASGMLDLRTNLFEFYNPNSMGYSPEPLTLICRYCGLVKPVPNPAKIDKIMPQLLKPGACPKRSGGLPHVFEQLDIVWVHWSGSVEPISPASCYWNGSEVVRLDSCNCSNTEYYLDRSAPNLRDWQFICTKCKTPRPMRQRDPQTLRIFGNDIAAGTRSAAEAAMEATSYRATAAFYVQADKLIEFKDSEHIKLLLPENMTALAQRVAALYGFPSGVMSDTDMKAKLKEAGREDEWDEYEYCLKQHEDHLAAGRIKPAEMASRSLARIKLDWEKTIFGPTAIASPALIDQVNSRIDYARKYDPLRLALEHEALAKQKLPLGVYGSSGKFTSVSVTDPDEYLVSSENEARHDHIINQTKHLLPLLGIAELKLIREFDLCEFSYGYSRMEPGPVIERHNTQFPVCLRLFPPVDGNHPVYVVRQANEAYYVKLSEEAVLSWLAANYVGITVPPGMRAGGTLIELYQPFSQYLDEFRVPGGVQRDPYNFTYMLLHTFAHHFLDKFSQLSGLELSSFGEHIFPADLSFVVYRKGTTMDLGNLSAMWRNNNYGILKMLLDPKKLRCGSGSLCAKRGGACPDCLMIPETSCLAGNNLLSRSVLIGQGGAHWDADTRHITGFFDVVREMVVGKP